MARRKATCTKGSPRGKESASQRRKTSTRKTTAPGGLVASPDGATTTRRAAAPRKLVVPTTTTTSQPASITTGLQTIQGQSPPSTTATQPASAATGLQTAVHSTLSNMLGTVPNVSTSESFSPNTTMYGSDECLGANVPERVRTNIKSNKFVEFDTLIDPKFNDQYTLAFAPSGQGSQVNLVPTSRSEPIYDIEKWTLAFHIYVAIYVEAYPHEAVNLMKYAEFVRDLARLHSGLAWRYYDRNFRNTRERRPYLSWGHVCNDIWNRALLEPQANGYTTGSTSKDSSGQAFHGQKPYASSANPDSGTCNNYNRRGFCTFQSCQFRHACQHCGGSHSRASCYQLKERDAHESGQQGYRNNYLN